MFPFECVKIVMACCDRQMQIIYIANSIKTFKNVDFHEKFLLQEILLIQWILTSTLVSVRWPLSPSEPLAAHLF